MAISPEALEINSMKAKWILLGLLAITVTCAKAQINQESNAGVQLKGLGFFTGTRTAMPSNRSCGIYETPDDRRAGTLSLAIACKSETHKIKPGFVKEKSAIKIIRNEETRSFLKKDISGYRDCKGNEYHFFEGTSYELLNPGESIPIYRVFEWRGKQRIAQHFFSTKESHMVRRLTIENIRDDFSDEPRFLKKLQVLAKNDFQLVKYRHAIHRIRMSAYKEGESGMDAL
jgi:hypothetical protein